VRAKGPDPHLPERHSGTVRPPGANIDLLPQAHHTVYIAIVYAWILQHDDRWSFIALYVSLAVVLSLWISLFWLVALVAVHLAFELVRQGAAGATGTERLGLALWEVKLDIALVLFALALSLYMEVVLGVLGLQAAARAGSAANASIRTGSRALAWERGLRGILLSADDAAQVGRVVGRKRGGNNGDDAALARQPAAHAQQATVVALEERDFGDDEQTFLATPEIAATAQIERSSGWRGSWGIGDGVAVALAAACAVLILAAPSLTGMTVPEAVTVLKTELHPFPR
jgi:hypothetical protein